MNEPNKYQVSSIDHATRNHTGKNIANRNMVSFKSRAGAVKRRNHFLTTEPEFDALPRSDAKTLVTTRQYNVMKGNRIVVTLASWNKATSYARSMGGRVSVV